MNLCTVFFHGVFILLEISERTIPFSIKVSKLKVGRDKKEPNTPKKTCERKKKLSNAPIFLN